MLCRMLACLAEVPVDRSSDREATSRGLGFLVAGEPAGFASPPTGRFEPETDQGLLARYLKWLELMREAAGACQSRSSVATMCRSIQLGPPSASMYPQCPPRGVSVTRSASGRANRSRSCVRIIGSSAEVMSRSAPRD